jgi:hypothetical protein
MEDCCLSQSLEDGAAENKEWITHPADIACQVSEVLNIPELCDLKKRMGEEHRDLSNKRNRYDTLLDFARQGSTSRIKEIILQKAGTQAFQDAVYYYLNNPTFEAFKVLDHVGLPPSGSHVFASTATANSSNDDAMTTALRILGWDAPEKGVTYQRTSTINLHTGLTAVGKKLPKNSAVRYDRHKRPNEWHEQAYDLALQFYRYSRGDEEWDTPTVVHKHTHIYHWGCINQCYLHNAFGHEVSCWAMHEKWNVVMTMAMMWHALMTLKPGGQLCLKTRIFKRAETLGLVALISAAFGHVRMVDNPRQVCTFVTVIYDTMTENDAIRLEVANALRSAMDQSIEHIFFSEVQNKYPICRQTARMATTHRESMMETRAEANTLFLMGLYCMRLLIRQRYDYEHRRRRGSKKIELDTCLETFHSKMLKKYGETNGQFFYSQFVKIERDMLPFDRDMLFAVLNSDWMKDNF